MGDEGQCRICLAGPEEGELIQPCQCQGSMRWVHATCLAQWWHHRSAGGVDVPAEESHLRCDICSQPLALMRKCDSGRGLFRFLRHRLFNCWRSTWQPSPRQAMRQHLAEIALAQWRAYQQLRELAKNHPLALCLWALMSWWTVAAIKVPSPPSHGHSTGPGGQKFLELGCWAFPLGLWCSVLRLAATPAWQREQEHWRVLFVSTCGCLLMVGATGTFASGLGPGLQSQPAVAPCNFACVLSPVVPLVLMKAEAQWLWQLWPPGDEALQVQTHLFWTAGIFAITMSNLLMSGFMSLMQYLGLQLVELLPATDAAKLQQQMMAQKPDPIDGLLWATYALSNVMAALHLPTVLRGLRLQAPEGLAVESWSRLGSFVVFIAAGDLLWLAICGSPWWVDIVQLWCLSFLSLCWKLEASPFRIAGAIILAPLGRLRSNWRLQRFRDDLQSGEVTFTNRQPLLEP
ncbi:unnamed protein product [Effrenium voratum]|uniref:RING-CH-type domain-containing protein n=1 Tax=Effrenium voratum TaxID=2562239 RepID=A0AA36JE79_9DINO|nr:unnamed protein product [Effrenium voratum]